MAADSMGVEFQPIDFSEDKLGGNSKKAPFSSREGHDTYIRATNLNSSGLHSGDPEEYRRLLERNGVHPLDAHHKTTALALARDRLEHLINAGLHRSKPNSGASKHSLEPISVSIEADEE
jgi:hypothetical protein